jgi:HSP20 family molecular chaperone IbpA
MSNLTKFYGVPSLLGRSVWDDLFTKLEPNSLVRRSTDGYPVTDLYRDDEGNSVIECALAGFDKGQLTIEVKEGRITINADQGGDDSDETTRRIAQRSFTRSFVDHSNKLDLEKAKASFENGLLRITVPPVPEEQSTIIAIKS